MRLLAAAAAVAVVLGACSSAPSPSDEPAEIAPVVVERDGVRVTLVVENVPVAGEGAWARMLIENQNDKEVRWAGGGCGDPGSIGIDLGGLFPGGRAWPGLAGRYKALALGALGGAPTFRGFVEESMVAAEAAGRPFFCTANLTIEQLAAGGTLSLRGLWDGTLDGVPVSRGMAIVTATFPFIGLAGEVPDGQFDTDAIQASVETPVLAGGGDVVLSPALAIDAALADPEFAAFVEAAPEPTWINLHVVLTDGMWEIGLFRTDVVGGARTLFGQVRISPDGAVVGRRFE